MAKAVILHLSDIHRTKDEPVSNDNILAALKADLKRQQEQENLPKPDILAISGDITQNAAENEYEEALNFINEINGQLSEPEKRRIIIVLGNHDIYRPDSEKAFYVVKRKPDNIPPEYFIEKREEYYITDKETYSKRLINFSTFHGKLYGVPYPLDPDKQFGFWQFPEFALEIIGLNSASLVDHLRSGGVIAEQSFHNSINHANQEGNNKHLRIALWHHDLNWLGKPDVKDSLDPAILGQMVDAEIHLGLCGHSHRAEMNDYKFRNYKIPIVTCGSLCAGKVERPESMPRLYNLIVIEDKISVHTRHRETKSTPWQKYAKWGDMTQSFYEVPVEYFSKNRKEDERSSRDLSNSKEFSSVSLPTDRTMLPPQVPLPSLHLMPHKALKDTRFIGRVNDLWKLHDHVYMEETVVIEGVGVVYGIAGLGKTQIAIEYVHRFAGFYPGGIFWIDATQSREDMVAKVSEVAGIKIDFKIPVNFQLEHLWRGFSTFKPALLILDNFPEGDEPLQPWLPVGCPLKTLVTTRRTDLDDRYSSIKLGCLNKVDGARLLNSGKHKLANGAEEISVILGGLPIALELTRAFINKRRDISAEKLLEDINALGNIHALAQFAKEYKDELPSGHEKQIAATFHLSWESLDELEKNILKCMSFLSPAPCPRKILRKTLDLPGNEGIKDELGKTLGELERISLIELDDDNDPFAHRLLMGFALNHSEKGDPLKEKTKESLLDETSRIRDTHDLTAYKNLEKLIPHVEHLLEKKEMTDDDCSKFLYNAARFHELTGRFQTAKKYYEKDLKYDIERFKPGHPSIATSQSNLALVLQDLGELDEARDLLKKAYSSILKKFGEDNPTTKIIRGNLDSLK